MFLSSHLMSEMAQTADHLLVIARGRIIADASTEEFVNRHSAPSVRVRAVEQADLADALTRRGALVERVIRRRPGRHRAGLRRRSAAPPRAHDITLIELAPHGSSLEEAFSI